MNKNKGASVKLSHLFLWASILSNVINLLSCSKNKSEDEAADLSGETTPIVVSGAQPVNGGTLSTVIATDSSGSSTVQIVSTTNVSMIVPSVADAITSSATGTSSITIAWQPATNASSYQAFISTQDNITSAADVVANGTLLNTNSAERTATAGLLQINTLYYFNVLAVDGLGRKVAYKRILLSTTAPTTEMPSAVQSVVSVVGGASSVDSGSSVTVKLQGKGSAGNNLNVGGATVFFMILSGTSTFNEVFPVAATDNGDGTYSTLLTGKLAGTPTAISALIDGVSSVSQTVVTVLPGPVSMGTSTVSLIGNPSTVDSGSTVTIQLRAKDQAGNLLTTGGAAVTFTKAVGSSSFVQSFPVTATDHGNGFYSATLTGLGMGSAVTLKAASGGVASTSSVSLGVNYGPISGLTSLVSIVGDATTVSSGSNATIKLTAKDAAGNLITTGGAAVSFSKSNGNSDFVQTFSLSALDNNNGTYTAILTGSVAGSPATLGASIGASAVVSTTSLTVLPGTISPATSVVSVVNGASTVASGSNVTLKLQAKDSAGNNLTAGSATVVFTLTGGTSTFSQSFPIAATNNGNGTYTATLTGVLVGSATTIGAQINATPVASSTSMEVIPGAASTATSVVTVVGGATTVNSGNAINVQLQAKDAAGNNLQTGGLTVAFTQSNVGSTFTQSFPVSSLDNNNGTYTATLTGNVSGSETTLGATIAGTSVSSTTGMTVNPGAISTATSVLSIVGGSSSVASGSSVTVRLTAKDAAGNFLTTGGASIDFNVGTGSSSFTQSFPIAATNIGNGTYTASITGNVSGSATTIGATINASAVTSTTTLTVNPGPINLGTSVVSIVGGGSTLASGTAATLRLQAKDAAGNNLASGGSTVNFTLAGGTSSFSQSFPLAANYDSNGIYSASVTGLVSGSAKTIGATVGGSAVTSTKTLEVIPGAISTANSLVSAGSSNVPNGVNVQVTLTAFDAANNRINSGGSTVTFSQSGGTSTFTQTFPVSGTNNNDGTYVATLTGNVAGTPTTIGAMIGAVSVASTTAIEVSSSVGASITGQPTGTNNTTVLAVTVGGTNVVSYKYKVGLTATTVCSDSANYGNAIGIGTPIITDNISGQSDGPTTLCVVGADSGPNWQPYSAATSANWVKKATPPSFTSVARANDAADGFINAAEKLLTSVLVGSLVGADYTTAGYVLVTSATACDGSLTYGALPQNNSGTFVADGSYKVCIKLSDTAGNTPAYGFSDAITLKTAAPTFTSVALANQAVDLFINSADRALANALAGSLSGSSYNTAGYKLVSNSTTCNSSLSYDVMPLGTSGDFGGDGIYKICVKLSDTAGNPADFGESALFELKTTAPAFTSLALANNATDGYINAAEKLLTNALAGSLSGTNYNTATYKLVSSVTTCDFNLVYGAMPIGTSGDFGADGNYKVCVKLTDTAGNSPDYGASNTIVLKTSMPGFSSLALANEAADTYINAADRLLANPLAGSVSGSNYNTAGYKLVTNATTCDVALVYGALPTGTSLDFGADGTYKVCVKLSDTAGNTPAFGFTAPMTLKAALPSFSSLALVNDAANGFINIAERSLTATLAGSISGTNYDTAEYKLVTNGTACDVALVYGAVPANNSGDFVSDGTYKVCAKLTDSAGNTPDYGSSSPITLDTNAPSLTLASTAANPTNVSPIVVAATFNEVVTGFVVGDITPANSTLSSFSGSGASYSFNLTPTGQLTATANVAAAAGVDAAGNPSNAATQFSRSYDSVAPTVNGGVTSSITNGTYGLGQEVSITVTFSENVAVTGTPTLALNITPTTRMANYTSGSGTNILTFSYTTQTGDTSSRLDYTSTSALTGTIKDGAGNNASLTLAAPLAAGSLGANKNIIIDTTAASVLYAEGAVPNGAYMAGQVISITVAMSEPVDVTGTPTISLNTSPARSASYASGTGTEFLVFSYTVQAGDTVGILNYTSVNSLALAGGTIRDLAASNSVLTLPSIGGGSSLGDRSELTIDTTAPLVNDVASPTSNSTHSVGAQIDVTVALTEPVYVTGSPRIQLNVTNTAVTTRYATYSSGSGTGALTFSYTVQGPNSASGDYAADLNYSSTAALTLNGGTLKDAAGNNLSLDLPGTAAAGSLGTNENIVIDSGLPPALSISGVTCCSVSALKAGASELTVQYPANTTNFATVKIFRERGTTAPDPDCASGTLVKTFSSGFSAGATEIFTDSTGNPLAAGNQGDPGRAYSYRVCAFDAGNAVLGTAATTNIKTSILHWIFSTKNAVPDGNLGGVAGANATCQTAGNTIDPTLTWVALLSDTAMEAKGRLPVAGTIYNRFSPIQAVATTSNALFGVTLTNSVKYAEDGTTQSGNAWTGTTTAGLRSATTSRCQNAEADWTSNSGAVNGGYGLLVNTATSWLTSATSTCSTSTNRLYCYSQAMEPLTSFSVATPISGSAGDVAVTLDFPDNVNNWTKVEVRRLSGLKAPTCSTGTVAKTYNGPTFIDETFIDAPIPALLPSRFYMYTVCVYSGLNVAASYSKSSLPVRTYRAVPAHMIFVTNNTYTGSTLGGITGADAICQTKGNTFITGKTWKAVLSTATVNANSTGRIEVASGAEVRNLNGALIATSNSDLWDGGIGAAISVQNTFGTTTASVWTGTTAGGAVDGTNTCGNWTGTSGNGRRALPTSILGTWIYNSTRVCTTAYRIYCFSAEAD